MGTICAAGGAAGTSAASKQKSHSHINKPGEVKTQEETFLSERSSSPSIEEKTFIPSPLDVTALPRSQKEEIREVLHNRAEEIKEQLLEKLSEEDLDGDAKTFWDKVVKGARETGSFITHEVFDEIAGIEEFGHNLSSEGDLPCCWC